MSVVSFNTPVYGLQGSLATLAGYAEAYLSLSDRYCVAIPGIFDLAQHPVREKTYDRGMLMTGFKVATYLTIVMPAIALLIKAAYRWNHSFQTTRGIPLPAQDDFFPEENSMCTGNLNSHLRRRAAEWSTQLENGENIHFRFPKEYAYWAPRERRVLQKLVDLGLITGFDEHQDPERPRAVRFTVDV